MCVGLSFECVEVMDFYNCWFCVGGGGGGGLFINLVVGIFFVVLFELENIDVDGIIFILLIFFVFIVDVEVIEFV